MIEEKQEDLELEEQMQKQSSNLDLGKDKRQQIAKMNVMTRITTMLQASTEEPCCSEANKELGTICEDDFEDDLDVGKMDALNMLKMITKCVGADALSNYCQDFETLEALLVKAEAAQSRLIEEMESIAKEVPGI